MEADVAVSTGVGADAGQELSRQLDVGNPDLVLFFPAINYMRERQGTAAYRVLESRYNCPVGGVSVGGVATHATAGFEFFGCAAVALRGLTFETNRVDNVWTVDIDQIRSWLVEHRDTSVLSVECGARDGTGVLWESMKRLARQIIQQNPLGQRKRLVQQLERQLNRNRFGYTNLIRAGMDAARGGGGQLGFTSGDNGPFLDGYEFWNGDVTNGRSGTLLATDRTFPHGVAQDAETTFDTATVEETFTDIDRIGRVIYRMDGKTVNDIWQEYRIRKDLSHGWFFSHYFLLETGDHIHALPFSADLNVLVSYVPLDDDITLHLVQSPEFDRYYTVSEQMLDGLGSGLPHISISPVQLELFHDAVTDIPEMADTHLDRYIITLDNNIRSTQSVEYNFPGYMVYR